MPMQWTAYYSDGGSLQQFDSGGEHGYAEIDRSRLCAFALRDFCGRLVICLHLDPGQRLIYRKRHEQRAGSERVTVYMVGWQQTIGGQNIQAVCYIFPDGAVHMAGRWREDHPLFYSIQQVACEQG